MLLHEVTLVLNRNWVPIDVTTVRHALVLVYQDVARIVNPADYSTHDFLSWVSRDVEDSVPCVCTISLRIPLPEVIVLSYYAGYPRRSAAFTRRNLLKRDNYSCQYCGAEPGAEKLTVDHVLPRSRGGTSCWENCVVACSSCNKRKGNRTPDEARMMLRQRPYRPAWSPRLVIGRTRLKSSWDRFVSRAPWSSSQKQGPLPKPGPSAAGSLDPRQGPLTNDPAEGDQDPAAPLPADASDHDSGSGDDTLPPQRRTAGR